MIMMETRPVLVFAMLVAALSVFSLPAEVSALGCREWTKLYDDERYNVLLDDVNHKLNSGRARSWNINRNRVARCVERSLRRLSEDLDDTCDQGMRVSMRAADELVMDYIRSCVQ